MHTTILVNTDGWRIISQATDEISSDKYQRCHCQIQQSIMILDTIISIVLEQRIVSVG